MRYCLEVQDFSVAAWPLGWLEKKDQNFVQKNKCHCLVQCPLPAVIRCVTVWKFRIVRLLLGRWAGWRGKFSYVSECHMPSVALLDDSK
jgi:hypothetical protein